MSNKNDPHIPPKTPKQPIDMFPDIKPFIVDKVGQFNNQQFLVQLKKRKNEEGLPPEIYLVRCFSKGINSIFTIFKEAYLPVNKEEFPEIVQVRVIWEIPNDRIDSIINVGRKMEVTHIPEPEEPPTGKIHQLN